MGYDYIIICQITDIGRDKVVAIKELIDLERAERAVEK